MDDFVLICSVGGSPEPIRKSIDQQRPRFVVYVASPASRKTIRKDIEDGLAWQGIEDTHVITLSDYQDLLACVRDIRNGLTTGLQAMSLPEDSLLVADITGGTKVMSAALTLVMMEYRSRFAYVGGDIRSKNGLGVVESGHETFMKQDNPWEVMALREVRSLARTFNRGDFASAMNIALELSRHVTGKEKFYAGIADLVQAYALWDAFDHKGALGKLRQALGRLEPFAVNHEALFRALALFKDNLALLETIQQDGQCLRASKGPLPEGSGRAYLRDLLAMQDEDGIIRIGLQRSFQLLAALEDPFGATYLQHEEQLAKLLEARNSSLLAHGYNPVSEDTANKLFSLALCLLDATEAELPRFPSLDWKCLLL